MLSYSPILRHKIGAAQLIQGSLLSTVMTWGTFFSLVHTLFFSIRDWTLILHILSLSLCIMQPGRKCYFNTQYEFKNERWKWLSSLWPDHCHFYSGYDVEETNTSEVESYAVSTPPPVSAGIHNYSTPESTSKDIRNTDSGSCVPLRTCHLHISLLAFFGVVSIYMHMAYMA